MPDVYQACERFEKLGVKFVKKPDGGKSAFFCVFVVYLTRNLPGSMKGLAFINDPDGYWIEILNPSNMGKI